VVDGLKRLPEAITSIFPLTDLDCIVHLIRNSVQYTTWKDREEVAAELKSIHRIEIAEAASAALERFSGEPQKYLPIVAMWQGQ
jgi:putative transposase